MSKQKVYIINWVASSTKTKWKTFSGISDSVFYNNDNKNLMNIREKKHFVDIVEVMHMHKKSWARLKDNIWAQKVLNWYPREVKKTKNKEDH